MSMTPCHVIGYPPKCDASHINTLVRCRSEPRFLYFRTNPQVINNKSFVCGIVSYSSEVLQSFRLMHVCKNRVIKAYMSSWKRYNTIDTLIEYYPSAIKCPYSIKYLSLSFFFIIGHLMRLTILYLYKHHPTGRVMQRRVHTTLTMLIILKFIWMFEIMVIENAEIYRQDVWVMKHQAIHHAIPIWR